jgi:uncharacterized membrane protein (UPF0182 family)
MWGRYHLSDPDDFYTEAGAWDVSQDPGDESTPGTSVDAQGDPTPSGRRAPRISPTYQILRLPTEDGKTGDPEFVITRPFVPSSDDDSRRDLTSFMAARSDPGHYGELVTYTVPGQRDGPLQVANTIRSNTRVASAETLLCQEGSDCTFGDLLTVPIGQSLLYVWPLYVESTRGQIPELRRVVVYWNGDVFIEPTLFEALTKAFGGSPPTLEVVQGRTEEPAPGDQTGETPTTPETPPPGDVAALLQQAAAAFQAADTALANRDLAAYQQQIDRAHQLVDQANTLAGAPPPEGTPDSSTTTSTTASA